MSDMNNILGLGQDVSFDGKTYRIADDLEFGVQADFERWLKHQAMQTGMEVSADDSVQADAFRRQFIKDSLGGAFRLDGEISRQALLGNPDASVELLFLLLEDGRRKAGDNAPEVTRRLAKRMLNDEKIGPWVQALCFMALGLDPTNALVMGTGLVMTRAAIADNRQQGKTVAQLKDEVNSKQSENSSETSLSFIVNYLDSLGASSTSSTESKTKKSA